MNPKQRVAFILKEQLCEIAAQHLTMPDPWFNESRNLSLPKIAERFQVSPLMVAVRKFYDPMLWFRHANLTGTARDYDFFDKIGFIQEQWNQHRPIIVIWMPNTISLHCRLGYASDGDGCLGIPEILGIRKVPGLFREKELSVWEIPYLIVNSLVPAELEEPDVHFELRYGGKRE